MATTISAKTATFGSTFIGTAKRVQSIVTNNLFTVVTVSGIVSVGAFFLDADMIMYAAGMVAVGLSTKAAGEGGEI